MTPLRPRLRRLTWFAAAMCALALVSGSAPAGAQSTRQRLDAARQSAGALRTRAGRIASAYARTEHALGVTQNQKAETQTEIGRSERDMAELNKQLKARVRTAYRMRGVGFFQFLIEARSFRDFSLRFISLQRQSLADEDLILKLRKKRHELELRRGELARQQRAEEAQKASLESQGRRISITLSQQVALERQLRGQIRREELARLFTITQGSGRGGMVIPLDACPLSGPRVITNSFGASRGGGTRRHQGNDIMAPQGAPIVAVVSGSLSTRSGGLGGLAAWLSGSDGHSYYYAHLSRFSVGSGARVSAGQTIGANGDTGNAEGGPPHLHFEIHPRHGAAVDPYPSLVAACA